MRVNNFKKLTLLLFVTVFIGCRQNKGANFNLLWSFEYTKFPDGLSVITTPPTIIGNSILISPDKQLTSLNNTNGNINWQFDIPGETYIATNELLFDQNRIYLKDDHNNVLYSINLKNGNIVWQFDLPSGHLYQFSNDAMDGNSLYIYSDNGKVLKIAKTGLVEKEYDIYRFGINDAARSIRIKDNQIIISQRYRGDDCESSVCGRIISFDKDTEDVKWEYLTTNGGFIYESIFLVENMIYAATTDDSGEVVALNANTGAVIWKVEGVPGYRYTVSDVSLLVNDGADVRAFDKQTGEQLWSTSGAMGRGYAGSNIAWYGDYVYHAHSGRLFVLNKYTGEVVHYEDSADGSPFYLTAAADGVVYAQSDYVLYAFKAWK